jgi:hypothetical protein
VDRVVVSLQAKNRRFEHALRLCRAFWPGRWLGATLAAAGELPGAFDVESLPEELDRIDRALSAVRSVNRYLRRHRH